jgi:hypothetical protein
MKVVLFRNYDKDETTGLLLVLHVGKVIYRCVTLELPDNGNQVNTSCIPEGSYVMKKTLVEYPNKGPCFHILDVPGRTDVLIHTGNYATGKKIDTLGCILPGSYFIDIDGNGIADVADSKNTMKALLSILPDTIQLYII